MSERRVIDGGFAFDNNIAGLTIYDGNGRIAAQIMGSPNTDPDGIFGDRAKVEEVASRVAEVLGLITFEPEQEPQFNHTPSHADAVDGLNEVLDVLAALVPVGDNDGPLAKVYRADCERGRALLAKFGRPE